MVRYRRDPVAGGSYFVTLVLADRRSDLLVRHVDLLRDAWRKAGARVEHRLVAAVVLPEHLHALVELASDESDLSRLVQEVKKGFTRRLLAIGVDAPSRNDGSREIWQRRFWEHAIRDECDLHAHVDYIHINPRKHGHVARVREWPHSSFHRFVESGWLSVDWTDDAETVVRVESVDAGEPAVD